MVERRSYGRPKSPAEHDYARPPEFRPFPRPKPGSITKYPEARYTPFLLVRLNDQDQGDRPVVSDPFILLSPDITIVGPSGVPNAVPLPGVPHNIMARVLNLGSSDSISVRVRFWAFPTDAFAILGDETVSELISTTRVFAPSQGSAVAISPTSWLPNADLMTVIVDVSDMVRDPITTPFDPFSDRHVAARGAM